MSTSLDIRPLEPSDARAAYEIVAAPEVARSLGGTPLDSPHAYDERLRASFDPPAMTDRFGAFEGPALVGFVEIARSTRPRIAHAAQLTLAVRPSAQRRGVGSALLATALDAADRWLNLVRLDAEMLAADAGAQRLFTRHGFEVETRRRAALVVDGALADTVTLGRLRPGFAQADGVLRPQEGVPPRGTPAAAGDVVVRAATADDAPALARLSRDRVVLWASTQTPTMTVDTWRRRLTGGWQSGVWTAVVEHHGEPVACGSVHGMEPPRRRHSVWLGMSVLTAFQGRGIGDRLLAALLDAAEGWLGAERVELLVFADNTRAVSLYRKHGFEIEGRARCDLWRDGGYADSLVMARLHPRAAPG